jgi:hypothetical protein
MSNQPITINDALAQESTQYKKELLQRMFGAGIQTSIIAGTTSTHSPIPRGGNIIGVGYGAKETQGSGTDDLAVRVYVRSKLSHNFLSNSERIPSSVNGMPTDVIATGDIVAAARPTKCGVSVGHFAVTSGTIGCLVKKIGGTANEKYILSNNHVLADLNQAIIGDDILEPGFVDGGNRQNPIARLTDFEPLDFSGGANAIDAAIAQVINSGDVLPDIEIIGGIATPPVAASLYQSVRKHGRTTRHTVGVIMDLLADIQVLCGTKTAWFENQIAVVGAGGSFSLGGDSGSLIVDALTKRPVGLLFAGGQTTTFANPINSVLARFHIEIV